MIVCLQGDESRGWGKRQTTTTKQAHKQKERQPHKRIGRKEIPKEQLIS